MQYIIKHYNTIDSTNEEAKRLVKQGQVHQPLVVISDAQTNGKGSKNRAWVSPEGNLYASLIIELSDNILSSFSKYTETLRREILPVLPFYSAVAIGEVLQNITEKGDIKYKWPNDILLSNKKVCGILIEVINNYAIIGFGVNIKSYPENNTRFPATCLQAENVTIKADQLVDLIVNNMLHKFTCSINATLQEWQKTAYLINENITFLEGERVISGIYKGIDANGRLLLDTKEGKRESFLVGEIGKGEKFG